ncbi:hypothetical protein JMJ56_15410 [Belnapia sp. T18]|uniref:Uncharacterized protein n=1 Tax=Belnapia arida TaxID=2804533 RepID=A0ABS1U7Y1_9PROT|nr:hypothetical protein [Belnapia arida]MBL6079406.1 hypothetical protein [Belnapia arida]
MVQPGARAGRPRGVDGQHPGLQPRCLGQERLGWMMAGKAMAAVQAGTFGGKRPRRVVEGEGRPMGMGP